MIGVKLLREEAVLPAYQTRGAAGADLSASQAVTVRPGERALIPTGLALDIPEGWEVQLRPRSGLSSTTGLLVVFGTIDSDYRGEVMVIVANVGKNEERVRVGDRVAQLVAARTESVSFGAVSSLSDTERGARGFGSTGR
jgi:dUTP pyrophosphatase